MYLENELSAFSDMTSPSVLSLVASFSSTPANASSDSDSEASRLWHRLDWASATSSSISPSAERTDAISSPMLCLLSLIIPARSFSSRGAPASPVEDGPAAPPAAPPTGLSRHAPLSLRVASAIKAPHFPKVRARADMSRRVSVRT